MSEYPPGSFGYEMDVLEARTEKLPWYIRWYWRRRVRAMRVHVAQLRDESLRAWFAKHW